VWPSVRQPMAVDFTANDIEQLMLIDEQRLL
jgi:hypothetical protein